MIDELTNIVEKINLVLPRIDQFRKEFKSDELWNEALEIGMLGPYINHYELAKDSFFDGVRSQIQELEEALERYIESNPDCFMGHALSVQYLHTCGFDLQVSDISYDWLSDAGVKFSSDSKTDSWDVLFGEFHQNVQDFGAKHALMLLRLELTTDVKTVTLMKGY